jgi:hypothetical protein
MNKRQNYRKIMIVHGEKGELYCILRYASIVNTIAVADFSRMSMS